MKYIAYLVADEKGKIIIDKRSERLAIFQKLKNAKELQKEMEEYWARKFEIIKVKIIKG